eukprot:1304158-Alexandrium_andersonii.AAC.1
MRNWSLPQHVGCNRCNSEHARGDAPGIELTPHMLSDMGCQPDVRPCQEPARWLALRIHIQALFPSVRGVCV